MYPIQDPALLAADELCAMRLRICQATADSGFDTTHAVDQLREAQARYRQVAGR
jgi:hypothetical protein